MHRNVLRPVCVFTHYYWYAFTLANVLAPNPPPSPPRPQPPQCFVHYLTLLASACLRVRLSICLPACLPLCVLSLSTPFCLYLFNCLSAYVFLVVSLSVCLPISVLVFSHVFFLTCGGRESGTERFGGMAEWPELPRASVALRGGLHGGHGKAWRPAPRHRHSCQRVHPRGLS